MLMHFYVHCWQRNPKSIYPSVSLNEQSLIFTGVKEIHKLSRNLSLWPKKMGLSLMWTESLRHIKGHLLSDCNNFKDNISLWLVYLSSVLRPVEECRNRLYYSLYLKSGITLNQYKRSTFSDHVCFLHHDKYWPPPWWSTKEVQWPLCVCTQTNIASNALLQVNKMKLLCT